MRFVPASTECPWNSLFLTPAGEEQRALLHIPRKFHTFRAPRPSTATPKGRDGGKGRNRQRGWLLLSSAPSIPCLDLSPPQEASFTSELPQVGIKLPTPRLIPECRSLQLLGLDATWEGQGRGPSAAPTPLARVLRDDRKHSPKKRTFNIICQLQPTFFATQNHILLPFLAKPGMSESSFPNHWNHLPK